MHDILFTPGTERIATSNAWAFLHCLRGGRDRPTAFAGAAVWSALRRAIAADPRAAEATFGAFANTPSRTARLALPGGPAPALILHRGSGPPHIFSGADLARRTRQLPVALAAALARDWDPARLLAARADLLLHLDLRPDDVVLLAGLPPTGWLPALSDGTTLIVAAVAPADLLPLASATGATVLAAPAGVIAEANFPRGTRDDVSRLRTVLAEGGPMAPAARARVYARIKLDVMLLARAGKRFWGNPLSPVKARPVAEAHLLTAAASPHPTAHRPIAVNAQKRVAEHSL